MDITAQIKATADAAVMQMRDMSGLADFGYNAAGVAWVDGFIERQRVNRELAEDTMEGLVTVLGAYFGQCIIENYGGVWRDIENEWCVVFAGRKIVYPFSLVADQFDATDNSHGIAALYATFANVP